MSWYGRIKSLVDDVRNGDAFSLADDIFHPIDSKVQEALEFRADPVAPKNFAATLSRFASDASGHNLKISFKDFPTEIDGKTPKEYAEYTKDHSNQKLTASDISRANYSVSIDGKPVGTLSAAPGETGSGAYGATGTDGSFGGINSFVQNLNLAD